MTAYTLRPAADDDEEVRLQMSCLPPITADQLNYEVVARP